MGAIFRIQLKKFKTTLMVAVLLTTYPFAYAQELQKSDFEKYGKSLRIHFGVFTGINVLTPASSGFDYNAKNGYEQGILGQLNIRLYKPLSLGIGMRYAQLTGLMSHSNNVYAERFYFNASKRQATALLLYQIKRTGKNLFDVGLGYASSQLAFSTSNETRYYSPPGVGLTSEIGYEHIKKRPLNGSSLLFQLSKYASLSNKFGITLLSEFEWFIPQINVVSAYYTPQNTMLDYKPSYRFYNYKIGVCFTY